MEFTHVANPVRVIAKVIANIDHRLDGSGLIDVEFEDDSKTVLNDAMIARYCPSVGDYVVTQEDGYVYVNPKEVFEHKYRLVEPTFQTNGEALADAFAERDVPALDRERNEYIARLEGEVARLREMENANSWVNASGLDARSVRQALVMQIIPARGISRAMLREVDESAQYILTGELPGNKE
jgi:hypothetical protein